MSEKSQTLSPDSYDLTKGCHKWETGEFITAKKMNQNDAAFFAKIRQVYLDNQYRLQPYTWQQMYDMSTNNDIIFIANIAVQGSNIIKHPCALSIGYSNNQYLVALGDDDFYTTDPNDFVFQHDAQ